jgi:hypothetical protein
MVFIEKVHILGITHFFETTKDRSLIFGMGGECSNASYQTLCSSAKTKSAIALTKIG